MQSIKEILENVGEQLVNEIKSRINDKDLNDTGSASSSLKLNATDTKLEIKGNRYIGALDKGRKPGKFPPPNKMIDYVTRNGIEFVIDGKSIGIKSTAFLMGKGISEKGTAIFRDHSKGIQLETIEEMGVKLIKKNVSGIILNDIKSKVMDLSKGASA